MLLLIKGFSYFSHFRAKVDAVFLCKDMVLDVMMPRLSGYEVCRRLVEQDRPAIILLTVKNDIEDKVLGLELGADDYMTMPFDMRELIARVKALARRRIPDSAAPSATGQEVLQLGVLTIESYSHSVSLEGTLIDLTPKSLN
jgi:two-component system alkaline phosphatase synthesis response regulator PhoP